MSSIVIVVPIFSSTISSPFFTSVHVLNISQKDGFGNSVSNQGCPMLTDDFNLRSSQDLRDLGTAEAGRHKSNEKLFLINKLMKVDSDEIHTFSNFVVGYFIFLN
jgi:hypothetical protein